MLAHDEAHDVSPPPMGGKRRPGPTHPTYGLPTEDWPMIIHRVVEKNEPLRRVAAAYGVSHETIRRILLHVQKPRGQQEASRSCSSDRGAMTFWQQESLRMRVVATCPSTFPCLFPAPCLQVQGRETDGPLCAAGLIGTPQAEPRRAVQQREAPGQGTGEGGKQDICGVCAGTTPALQAEAGWVPIAGNTPCARIS